MSAPQRYKLGIACAVVAALCFSTAGLLMRRLELDVWEIVFWRCVFGGLPLALFFQMRYRGRLVAALRGTGLVGLVSGLGMAYMLTVVCFAFEATLVANVLAFLSVTPFLTALIGWVVMRERVTLVTWLGMVVALAGILMIVVHSLGAGDFYGNVLALSLAIVYAGYLVMMRRGRARDMLPATLYAMAIGAAVALPFAVPFDIGWSQLPYLVAFGAGQLGGGLILLTLASRHMAAAPLSLIMMTEMVAGVLWAWLGAGEQPVAITLAGAGLVLLAAFGNTLHGMRRVPRRAIAG